MPVTDLCEAIAAVLYPQLVLAAGVHTPTSALPVVESLGDAAPPPADAARDELPDAYTAIHTAQQAEWFRIVGELTAVRDWGEDPLLHALDAARRRRDQIDEDIKLLITLAREFVGPRPYDFSTLARTSGLTQYLVRRVSTPDDVECIHQVTGLVPRMPAADLEEPVAS